jgi:hypothetical protein
MMSINESIICYDPAEALRSESGVFEGVSPGGEHFQFILPPRAIHYQRALRPRSP